MLIEQIEKIPQAMEFNYSTCSIIPKRKKWTKKYMISLKGEENLKRWFEEVRPRNPKFIIHF